MRLRLIGDVMFTTPIVRALRRHFPNATLTYVVEPFAAPVIGANPHLDDVIIVPRRRGMRRLTDDLRVARMLRARRYDIAVDLHGGPRSAWLTLATGAPRRIGYAIRGRTWMYTDVVERAAELLPRHSVENQWDLLRPLGIEPLDPARDAVEMAPDPEARARVEHLLRAAGFTSDNRLAVVHVSAGNPFRRWPLDCFATLAAELTRRHPELWIALTSGPSERAAAAQVAQFARDRRGPTPGTIIHPDVDVAELREMIAGAAVYIGGDSGPLHIAASTTTPIVALFGPTLAERSRPWRDPRWFAESVDAGPLPCRPCHQRRCEPGDFRCLTRITAEQVIAAAERALAAYDKSRG